jgi:hypothetical protein
MGVRVDRGLRSAAVVDVCMMSAGILLLGISSIAPEIMRSSSGYGTRMYHAVGQQFANIALTVADTGYCVRTAKSYCRAGARICSIVLGSGALMVPFPTDQSEPLRCRMVREDAHAW